MSLYNGLMEHSAHIEQQIHMEETSEAESLEEQLKHHLPLQDMVKRAPQDTVRKGNELLRTLERVRGWGLREGPRNGVVGGSWLVKQILIFFLCVCVCRVVTSLARP